MAGRFNNRKGYCCSFIKVIVERNVTKRDWSHSIPFHYDPVRRRFYILDCRPWPHEGFLPGDHHARTGFTILHCPCCGAQLPEGLFGQWLAMLEQDFGITDPDGTDKDRIPPEFRTDAWWKKGFRKRVDAHDIDGFHRCLILN